ncbi:hypothetical protein NL676_009721 [Syzygium grande]|nr:hypothetical protein NL676_009721 [Syzygium grande]
MTVKMIDEELKASMKRVQRFLYDYQDAINDLTRRESNCEWQGCVPYSCDHYSRRTFVSEPKDIKRMVDSYKATLEMTAAMKNSHQLSADHANSSSACHWSSFSEENDDGLVGIGEAREKPI